MPHPICRGLFLRKQSSSYPSPKHHTVGEAPPPHYALNSLGRGSSLAPPYCGSCPASPLQSIYAMEAPAHPPLNKRLLEMKNDSYFGGGGLCKPCWLGLHSLFPREALCEKDQTSPMQILHSKVRPPPTLLLCLLGWTGELQITHATHRQKKTTRAPTNQSLLLKPCPEI